MSRINYMCYYDPDDKNFYVVHGQVKSFSKDLIGGDGFVKTNKDLGELFKSKLELDGINIDALNGSHLVDLLKNDYVFQLTHNEDTLVTQFIITAKSNIPQGKFDYHEIYNGDISDAFVNGVRESVKFEPEQNLGK